jgi:hypothetical protein
MHRRVKVKAKRGIEKGRRGGEVQRIGNGQG